MHGRSRLVLIVGFIWANGVLALTDVIDRRFPMGIGAVLCLVPCLLRELDLKHGLAARRLGRFEWSFILSGILWVGSCLIARAASYL